MATGIGSLIVVQMIIDDVERRRDRPGGRESQTWR
jgi:hypothetical protein